jgi:aminopeptidase N
MARAPKLEAPEASHPRRWRRLSSLAATLVLVLIGASAALAGSGSHGSAGIGDPFFPKAGNGGYEVDHYDLRLRYAPSSRRLQGTEEINATATQDLSRFDLDLRGLHPQVVVEGRAAHFVRNGQELVITPQKLIHSGDAFVVQIGYSGTPKAIRDPDGSLDGWIHTSDGAWVASEPQGSPTWFPVNDHPSDKARFRIDLTVRKGLKAVSNGRLVGVSDARHNQHTFHWHEPVPMAPYLATATIGKFKVRRSKFDGLRSYVAVDPSVHGYGPTLAKIPKIVRFYESKYGPYPFDDVGAIVDPSPAGYSLETQTRPLLPGPVDEITLAHELSHQWFGDSVSLSTWPDIWLNEGFATFSEWLWAAHTGGPSLKQEFNSGYSTPASDTAYWNPPPGDPGRSSNLFDGTIYDRGGLTLEALREKIGSHDFFSILRQWAADHRHANATTQEFIDLASSVSGLDLTHFFNVWLYRDGKPASGSWKRHARAPFTGCSRPRNNACLASASRHLSGAFTYRGGR